MRFRAAVVVAVALVTATAAGCSGDDGAATELPDGGQPTATSPPPTRTPVPAPSKDNTKATKPNDAQASKSPVALDKPTRSGGVVAEVTKIKAVSAKAQLPGEVAGPGLLLTVRLQNKSEDDLDLDVVLVTVYDSTDAPAGEMTMAPNNPMQGSLAPGETASGNYLFTISRSRRSPIVVNVTLPKKTPVMVFRGDAPT
jgi:hypothetical protein